MICLFFSVYLEIGAADTDQGALEFTFDGGNTNGRQFEVKVTQILCNSASRYFIKLLCTACCRILTHPGVHFLNGYFIF